MNREKEEGKVVIAVLKPVRAILVCYTLGGIKASSQKKEQTGKDKEGFCLFVCLFSFFFSPFKGR